MTGGQASHGKAPGVAFRCYLVSWVITLTDFWVHLRQRVIYSQTTLEGP